MELLQAGVDCSVIALWLGHESIETTQIYLHAHLALKQAALAKLKPYERGKRARSRPNDRSAVTSQTIPNGKETTRACRKKAPRQRLAIPEPLGIVRRAA
jgi:hypothetical protein